VPNPTWPILLFKICHTWSVYYGQLTQPGQSFFCLSYQRNSKAGSPKPAQGSHCPGGDKVDNRDMFWTYQLSFFLLFFYHLNLFVRLKCGKFVLHNFFKCGIFAPAFLSTPGALFVSCHTNPLQGFVIIPNIVPMSVYPIADVHSLVTISAGGIYHTASL